MGGYEERSPHHVRLQPTQCKVAFGKSWRQACDAQLWDRYSWVRRARRCHDSGVRPSGNGACVLPGGRLYSIRFPRLRCAQNDLPDGDFPDGQMVLLTELVEGQEATVLQLPAQPATAAEAEAQERVAYVG